MTKSPKSTRRIWATAVALGTTVGSLMTTVPASATPIVFQATLAGTNEVPPNASPALGLSIVTLQGNLLLVNETFSGLTAPASAAHIHCCGPVGMNEPVAVPFVGFPSAATGVYMNTFDLTLTSTYTAGFLSANGGTALGAENALINGLEGLQAYANIHDSNFPGGEIRGQLSSVPEPATLTLTVLGLAGAALRRRRQSRSVA
jgi:hypothetical protein